MIDGFKTETVEREIDLSIGGLDKSVPEFFGQRKYLEEDIKNFPKIKITGNNTKYSFNNDGTIAAKLNPSFAPVSDSKEIKWKVSFVEIRGE